MKPVKNSDSNIETHTSEGQAYLDAVHGDESKLHKFLRFEKDKNDETL